MNSGVVHYAVRTMFKELPVVYRKGIEDSGAENIEEIINVHAMGAAASGLAAGFVPGIGGTAALMASADFIWSMYYRINNKLGIPLSKAVVKSLGAAVLTNLAGSSMALVGGAALATALSFTGIGNVFSSLIMGALDYAVVLVSGIIYMKILVGLFKAGKNVEDLSAEDLKAAAENVIKSEDVNTMLKEARDSYKKAYKAGEVSGKETLDLEEDVIIHNTSSGEIILENTILDKKVMIKNKEDLLTNIKLSDIDFEKVDLLENNGNAHKLIAKYGFGIEKFINGVALVWWTLYPDGRYFEDEDGYGGQRCNETRVYAFMDTVGNIVIPFQDMSQEDIVRYREIAEQAIKD